VFRRSLVLLTVLCGGVSACAESKFVGSVGCKSSSCHSGAGEKRSQYITWSQKDFHTRAYTILLDARSARIGEALGALQPQSSAGCTVCHSPFQSVAADRLASTARPDEGVFCENCHGAAESWLRGHTRSDWTDATRVSAGMRDLRNLYARANACVVCHQNVDPEILKAGHPELVFKLDSQSNNEPKHWRDDDPASGPQSWLIGQAVALREIIWAVNNATGQERDRLFTQASALTWLLDKAGLGGNVSSFSAFPGIQLHADGIARDAAKWSPTNDQLMSIAQTLAASDSEFQTANTTRGDNFYRALRLTLALDRLSAALNLLPKIDKELGALRADVQRHYDFDNVAIAKHLRDFRQKL
jgi:predicted CXXCH cytochrome family protein